VSAILVSRVISLVTGGTREHAARLVAGGTLESIAKSLFAITVVHAFIHAFAALFVGGIVVAALVYAAYVRVAPSLAR
jgi:hypothetical protein